MSLRGADKANLAEVPTFVHVVAMTCSVRGKQGDTWFLSVEPCLAHQTSTFSDIGISFGAQFLANLNHHYMEEVRTPTESDLLLIP